MGDLVKQMVKVWHGQGAQAAHDRGTELLKEASDEIRGLRKQHTAITTLMNHLQESGAQTPQPIPSPETLGATSRPQAILKAAEAVMTKTPEGLIVKVPDVLAELERQHLALGVKQPLAVIGTVLSRSKRYRKETRNTFHAIGEHQTCLKEQ